MAEMKVPAHITIYWKGGGEPFKANIPDAREAQALATALIRASVDGAITYSIATYGNGVLTVDVACVAGVLIRDVT